MVVATQSRVKIRFSTYSSLVRWLVAYGLVAGMLVVVLVLVAVASRATLAETFEVLLGITSPFDIDGPRIVLVAISVVGWTAVPAVIGAVAGLAVDRQIASTFPRQEGVVDRLEAVEDKLRSHPPPREQ